MATAILFGISGIAIAALFIAAYLLDQRRKLLHALVTAGNAYAAVREEAYLMKLREAALIRHARQAIEERNLLRAQLVAYTEPPRFGRVLRGVG